MLSKVDHKKKSKGKRMRSHSFGFSLKNLKPIEGDKISLAMPSDTGFASTVSVDTSWWLPKAAEIYNISKNLEDYVIVPVIAFISDLPNTNGDCFTKEEMLRFNPEHGMLAFQTFKGKPTFVDHNNTDHTKAKGVIFDVEASLLKGYKGNHMKVTLLSGFDRTRDPWLVQKILSGDSNTYSMGAYYDAYECSICGHKVGKGHSDKPCEHTQLKRPTYKHISNQLAFRKCLNPVGFENSLIPSQGKDKPGNPAFVSAVSDVIL